MNKSERLSKISNIDPDNFDSWSNKIFITFDIDWAEEFIIDDTLNLLQRYNIPATFFTTHQSSSLEFISSDENIEIGIHPNFKPLLNSETNKNYIEEELDRLLKIVPDAKSVRSHCLIQGSPFEMIFRNKGITHQSNIFVPSYSEIILKPWRSNNGLIQVPYGWEDDVVCDSEDLYLSKTSPVEEVKNSASASYKIFDFHPIHIYLNTENLSRYEITREYHKNYSELVKYRNKGYGTRNRFIELLKFCSSN